MPKAQSCNVHWDKQPTFYCATANRRRLSSMQIVQAFCISAVINTDEVKGADDDYIYTSYRRGFKSLVQ